MSVRLLGVEDLAAFRALRLDGLRLSPESFGAHVEDEETLPHEALAGRIAPTERTWVLGAFDDRSVLRGLMGWYRERGRKIEHRSMIWGAYVQPEYRRCGMAAALLSALLARAQAVPDLLQVQLHVGSWNLAAKALYAKFGFRFVALHPQSLRVGARFVDEELWVLPLSRSN